MNLTEIFYKRSLYTYVRFEGQSSRRFLYKICSQFFFVTHTHYDACIIIQIQQCHHNQQACHVFFNEIFSLLCISTTKTTKQDLSVQSLLCLQFLLTQMSKLHRSLEQHPWQIFVVLGALLPIKLDPSNVLFVPPQSDIKQNYRHLNNAVITLMYNK